MSTRVPREKAVFVEALEIADPEQRRQFLDNACGADQALREQIDKLLALSQSACDFFKDCSPALEPEAADAAQVLSAAESAVGPEIPESKCIGPYKLLQKLGEGGYGVVYMAEQERPIRRRVALKIIKLGMDTKNVIARFEAERQALALMDHPNIARVLDAGATETGRPYFVMELVYGVKITEYCDQNGVSMRERLQLFIQVCNAVQHAHQKGIIHRDLKPSNIMVTMHDGVPVPKVIDFGIAKATEQRLTDKTLFTSYAQLMGTPAYMSPEQMEFSGLNLDTRSDVYSLGVLLYELLTGRTPFDTTDLLKLGVDELRRTVREQEPLSPSAKLQTLNNEELTKTARRRHIEPPRLLSQLRGDLDWIVLKCLEKDRTRRYATATGLTEDIERYLHEEAILARPPSRLYRLQKLVRRNRVVFLFAAAAAAALFLGSIISTWLLIKEREALRSAVAARQETENARATESQLRRAAESRETVKEISLLMAQDHYEQADALLSRVPLEKPSPETESLLRILGDWNAISGRWPQAIERFASLTRLYPTDGLGTSLDHFRLGTALLESGNRDGYERFRQQIVSRFGGAESTTNSLPDWLISSCLLLPANQQLLENLNPMAEAAEKTLSDPDRNGTFRLPGISSSLALLEYRRGNDQRATALCARCLSSPDCDAPRAALAHGIQALSYWRLGQYAEGFIELSRAQERIDSTFKKGLSLNPNDDPAHNWFDWVLPRILIRECREQCLESDRSLAQMTVPNPSVETAAKYRVLGEWHALRQEWRDAAERFGALIDLDRVGNWETITLDYFKLSLALVEAGKRDEFNRCRQDFVAQYGQTTNATAANRVIKSSLLMPAPQELLELLEPCARACEEVITNNYVYTTAWNSLSLEVLEYRRGNYARASELSRKCLALPERNALWTTTAQLILAMSYWQMHQYREAVPKMIEAQTRIESEFENGLDPNPGNDPEHHWYDWVVARILLRECQEQVLETDRSLAQAALPPASLASAADYRALGEWHALRQEWRIAAEWFGALLKIDRLDDWDIATLDYLARGTLLAETGDKKSYETFREEAVSRFKGTDIQAAAERIIKISLLQPADAKEIAALAPLTEVAARPFTQTEEGMEIIAFREAWRAISLGLLEYRSGDYAKATEWCRLSLACRQEVPVRTATARLILAMSLRQRKEHQAALSELEQARKIIESGFDAGLKSARWDRGLWFDWLFARALLRETSELLRVKPDSVTR
ncbi:MAG TPA: protein kinase [Candidatus Limnocylindrales bacterium]|jgi:serine/threonine protein kinase|nr:protein kinase [Candidatus Limnocylindrales bacterium]